MPDRVELFTLGKCFLVSNGETMTRGVSVTKSLVLINQITRKARDRVISLCTACRVKSRVQEFLLRLHLYELDKPGERDRERGVER